MTIVAVIAAALLAGSAMLAAARADGAATVVGDPSAIDRLLSTVG